MNNTKECTLGMELEVKGLYAEIASNNESLETLENHIKGFPIDKLYYGKIDLTLDMRSPNNTRTKSDKVSADIEYVFNHIYFPTNELHCNDWNHVTTLLKTNIEDIKNNNDNKYRSITNGSKIYNFSIKYLNLKKEDPDIMIHLTCAYPLCNIFNENMRKSIMGDDYGYLEDYMSAVQNDYVLNIGTYSEYERNSCLNFIALLWSITNAAETNPDISPDPKQKINIMNRTALGSMYLNCLNNNSCNFIHFFLEKVLSKDCNSNIKTRLDFHLTKDVTNKDLINYILDISNEEDDPLIKTTEKIGISQLKDKFENGMPIFEIRDCGSIPLSKLSIYMQKVCEMINKRNELVANFHVSIINQ